MISHPTDPPTSAKVIRLSLPTSVGQKIPGTMDENKSTTDENPLTLEAPVSDEGHIDGPRNRHCGGSDGYIETYLPQPDGTHHNQGPLGRYLPQLGNQNLQTERKQK